MQPLASGQIDRYLTLLGVEKSPPTRTLLAALVRAHVTRIPFENISKLYYKKQLGQTETPCLEQFLSGVETHHFGGTCYTCNIFFHQLLAGLGYETRLCGAAMSGGDDDHATILVEAEGHEFLVDVGYAAPFLSPLPRDLDSDVVVSLGNERYVLKPRDAQGRSRLELFRDGKRVHGYLAFPTNRGRDHFAEAMRNSYSESATFMNALLLVQFFENRSVKVYNLSVIESVGTTTTVRRLRDFDELIGVVDMYFGIPAEIVRVAVSGLGALRDVYG